VPPSTRPAELIRLYIHHRHANIESGPAEPAGTFGARKLLRLKFIPFGYAAPTYDDIVVAAKDPELEGNWSFECPEASGVELEQLYEHGGRYAMIVDFVPGGEHNGPWLPGRSDIVSSLALKPTPARPGRIYLAVPDDISRRAVMRSLKDAHPEFRFELIHPGAAKRA
jgi:hypothetical protein